MINEEWGPWNDHDGKGCPVVGQYIQCETDLEISHAPDYVRVLKPKLAEYIPRDVNAPSWTWEPMYTRVVRYRVRKPKGLRMLEQILRELPAPTKIKEKA